MSDERALRAQARQAMKLGSLPKHRPEHIWGGLGSGASCALCSKGIGPEDMEFELQFPSTTHPDSGNYHVHVNCFAAWERERRNEGSNGHVLPRASGSGIISCDHTTASRGEEG
jgi:hypothetical protein